MTQSRMILGAMIVIALLVFLAVGSVWLGLARTRDLINIVQSAVTITAIVAGGLFAIFKLQLFRDLQPHLTITQEVAHRYIGDSYVHIAVTSTLNNTSRVKVELRKGLYRAQRILPTSDEEVEHLYAQVYVHREHTDFQWPALVELSRIWEQNQLVIEPGESHQETWEVILSSEVRSVLVYAYFYNPSGHPDAQAAEGWAATTIHDMI